MSKGLQELVQRDADTDGEEGAEQEGASGGRGSIGASVERERGAGGGKATLASTGTETACF